MSASVSCLVFNDFYLNTYQTDLRQIFRVSRTMGVDTIQYNTKFVKRNDRVLLRVVMCRLRYSGTDV